MAMDNPGNDKDVISMVFIAYDLNNTFIINELKYYGERKIKILIFTLCDIPIELLSFDSLELVNLKENTIKKRVLFFSYFPTLIKILLNEIKCHFRNINYLFSIKQPLLILLNQLDIALQIKKYVKNNTDNVFMSYWFFNEALSLSFLSELGVIPYYFTRAHAFDIYEEDRPFGVIPFRNFQLKHVKKVLSVSLHGTNYFKKKFPYKKNVFETSYLGTYNSTDKIQFNPEGNIQVISCGSVQYRKRTNLIYEVLFKVSKIKPVEWTHIGDGPQFEEFFGNVKKEGSIKINLLGNLSNDKILALYESNPYSFFLSLSDNEGIPVSIMEAISYGIPVIATNAGGCAEIVNQTTGILIPVDFDQVDLIEKIVNFQHSKFQTLEGRQNIKTYWHSNFNAEINYNKTIAQLKS